MINHMDYYFEDATHFMKNNQGMICLMLYGILGAFGSADWMTHAIGRLLFMLL